MSHFEHLYYKAMVAVMTGLIAVCTFFIINIFKKADMTYEYVVGHKIEYQQLKEEVDKINKAHQNKEVKQLTFKPKIK